MTDTKKLANKEQQSDSAAGRRRKRGVSAAGKEARRNDADSAGTDAITPPRSAIASNATSGDAGYLSAEDLKHFREIFKSKVEHDSQSVPPGPATPDAPAAAEQRPATSADAPRRKRRGRGPQKSPTKVLTSIRLDKEVYEYFRDTGRGWQSRINDFLADKMRREQRSKRRKARAAGNASSSSKSV